MVYYEPTNGEMPMTKSEIETAIDEQAAEVGLDLGMRRDAFQDLPCEKKFATILTGESPRVRPL